MLTPTNNAPASFPLGTTTVTYTATDAAGNTGTATQTVTVVDTTPPAITAPAAVTSTSSGAAINMNIGTATATDLFPVTVTNNAPTTFPIGITTVIWTATDANGNSATATQLVTVNLLDTIPPVITVPADVFTSTYTSQATVNLGTASAVDNVDGIVAVTNNAPVTFPVGVMTVTYTASDAAGNTATATQRVIVSFVSTVGGGTGTGGGGMGGGTVTPPTPGGGATVGVEAIYWHHNDHLGTPQALTDINGTVVWTMSQTPFGIATVNEDPDGNGIKVMNNFRFPGQYFDAETGLNYNYQRTYDPAIGSYTQHDPIGLSGGMNPFGYVGGDPVTGVDPNGLFKITTGGAFSGFDYSAILYDSNVNTGIFNSGFFPPQKTQQRVSTTLIGGGLGIVFTLPFKVNTLSNEVGVNVGLNKFMSVGFNSSLSEVSINLGAGIGLPVSFDKEINPDFTFLNSKCKGR